MASGLSSKGASASLVTAANYIKRGSRAILARREDGVRASTAQQDCLIEWFKRKSQILSSSYCRRYRHFGGGAEHEVFFDLNNRLAIKTTHPNKFGWSAACESVPATPLEYLTRLLYQNWFFGDDIQLIGALTGDDHMEVVTSQPWISGDKTRPPASDEQIIQYFATKGFQKSEQFPGGGFFYNPELNVVAADAHSRNVLVSSQGQITPIDIVMGRPGKALEAKLRREILPPQAPEKIATTATANTAVTYYTYKPE